MEYGRNHKPYVRNDTMICKCIIPDNYGPCMPYVYNNNKIRDVSHTYFTLSNIAQLFVVV